MTETLQEFVDSRGASMQVDAEAGVIRGVKILGLTSRNGRTYLPEALSEAAALYENAKVNVNHPKGNPAGPRDYQDRIGSIRNVAVLMFSTSRQASPRARPRQNNRARVGRQPTSGGKGPSRARAS